MSDSPAAGWYPADDHTERFWDGAEWSDKTRPRVVTPPPPVSPTQATDAQTAHGKNPLATGLILAAGVVGLIMAAQGASLLSGTGTLWTGVAVGVGAVIVAFVVKAKVWVKVIVVLAAAAGIANTISVEVQLNDMRESFGSQSSNTIEHS